MHSTVYWQELLQARIMAVSGSVQRRTAVNTSTWPFPAEQQRTAVNTNIWPFLAEGDNYVAMETGANPHKVEPSDTIDWSKTTAVHRGKPSGTIENVKARIMEVEPSDTIENGKAVYWPGGHSSEEVEPSDTIENVKAIMCDL